MIKELYTQEYISMLYIILSSYHTIAYSNTYQKWHLTNKSTVKVNK